MTTQQPRLIDEDYDFLLAELYNPDQADSRYRAYLDTWDFSRENPANLQLVTVGVRDRNRLLGHALVQRRSREVFVGFIDLVNDLTVALQLLDAISRAAHEHFGAASWSGPIDRSFWHGARFKAIGDETLPFEPSHPAYYFDLLGPLLTVADTAKSYTNTLSELTTSRRDGPAMRPIDLHELSKELSTIYEFSREVFADTPAAPTREEFLAFYEPLLIKLDPTYCLLAEEAGRLIGFCFSFRQHQNWYVKTLAVAGDYRRLGVGSALYNRLAGRALGDGATTAYYLTVRQDRLMRDLLPAPSQPIAEYHLVRGGL